MTYYIHDGWPMDISCFITWCLSKTLVLDGHTGFLQSRVCSFCISFSCIVYRQSYNREPPCNGFPAQMINPTKHCIQNTLFYVKKVTPSDKNEFQSIEIDKANTPQLKDACLLKLSHWNGTRLRWVHNFVSSLKCSPCKLARKQLSGLNSQKYIRK